MQKKDPQPRCDFDSACGPRGAHSSCISVAYVVCEVNVDVFLIWYDNLPVMQREKDKKEDICMMHNYYFIGGNS